MIKPNIYLHTNWEEKKSAARQHGKYRKGSKSNEII